MNNKIGFIIHILMGLTACVITGLACDDYVESRTISQKDE